MKKTLTLVLIAVVAFFYLFEAEKVQQTTPVAKKKVAQKAVAINYEGAMVIKNLDNIDDILSELESEPTAGAGTFDLTTISNTITTEALKAFSDSTEHSLPLLAHWNVGIPEYVEAMDPMYMISRIELGEHVLVSWKLDPYYNDSISSAYYEESIKKAAELNLPLVFVLPAPESALTKDSYYFSLESATNPNVVTTAGDVLERLSPFGADELWNEVGEQWTSTSLMAQLQEWYPNPPLVLFVSEDEAVKLSWSQLSQESRFTTSGDDNFKRTLVGAEWIEKYRQMHNGFKKGFVNTIWKDNVKFMTYNKFSENLGESNWLEDATLTNHYMNIWPLTADGFTVDFDLSGSKTDNSADAPHILVNNLPFMLNEAKLANPNFAYQLSLDTVSKVTEPAKYRGLTQFALWFLRPSIIRQVSQESDREALAPLFQEVADSVELIHYNPQLTTFWREGKLVNSGESDLNQNIPEQYLNDPRWFLLETDANPPRPWADNTSIPVWAFALVKGEVPNREWLVYAQSPDGDINDITVSIPGYKDILVDSRVNGSFYILSENNNIKSTLDVNNNIHEERTSINPYEGIATYQVKSTNELHSAIQNARAGDIIEVTDGLYNNEIFLKADAISSNPIIVRAKTIGGVIITKKMNLQGSWITVAGFNFTGTTGSININTKSIGMRITRSRFIDSMANNWIVSGNTHTAGATLIEIDHNEFLNKTNNTTGKGDRVVVKIWVNNLNERHYIHHNYFKNIPRGNDSNGFEIIQLITKGNPSIIPNGSTNILIENNLFDNAAGESEIISIKNNGTIIRKNTFTNCLGYGIVLRHGKGSLVENNIFSNSSGGIRVNDINHIIKNNYFKSLKYYALGFYDGTDHYWKNSYIQVKNTIVDSNIFVDNKYAIVTNLSNMEEFEHFPIRDVIVSNNKIRVGTGYKATNFISTPLNLILKDNYVDGALGSLKENDVILKKLNLSDLQSNINLLTIEDVGVSSNN